MIAKILCNFKKQLGNVKEDGGNSDFGAGMLAGRWGVGVEVRPKGGEVGKLKGFTPSSPPPRAQGADR